MATSDERSDRAPDGPRPGAKIDDPQGSSGTPDSDLPIGIVVVNYGSHRLIESNLGSVEFGDLPVQVVVVDNHSSDQELADVGEVTQRHGWDLVTLPDNRGFGGGVNAGVARAWQLGCDSVLLLNPDASLTRQVVAELHAHCRREPFAMIAPKIVTSAGRVVFQGSEFEVRTGRIRSVIPHDNPNGYSSRFTGPAELWLTGACVALHRTLWTEVVGFWEPYFLYWEDVDLSYRVVRAGATLVVRRDLEVVHDEGGTQKAGTGRAKSDTYYYYNCRNRLMFAARHLPGRDVVRWILLTPAESTQILLRGGRRQLLRSALPLTATVAGSVVGCWIAVKGLLRRKFARTSGPTSAVGGTGAADRRRALICHPGSELYGSDRVMLESVEALRGAGYDVVVTLPNDGPLAVDLRNRSVPVVLCRTPVLRKSALRPRGMVKMVTDAFVGLASGIRLVWAAGRDVVVVNTITIPAWLVLARVLGRPAICHVHEAESTASSLLRRMMNTPLLLARKVVVNSTFSCDVVTASIPSLRDRSVVLYNGVAGPAQLVPARERLDSAARLLYLGRLSPRKGPQVALSALDLLVERKANVELSLLGSVFPGYEWFESDLREFARREGLLDRVRFLGFDADVWPHLADTDIVIVPSVVDEPFGNTAVEAILAGRPLVVSKTSGLLEAARGFASAQPVPPENPGAIADAVEGIIADWSAMRRRALDDAAVAQTRYAPDRYRTELVAIVGSVVGRQRQRVARTG